jgi:hypothetical protein
MDAAEHPITCTHEAIADAPEHRIDALNGSRQSALHPSLTQTLSGLRSGGGKDKKESRSQGGQQGLVGHLVASTRSGYDRV